MEFKTLYTACHDVASHKYLQMHTAQFILLSNLWIFHCYLSAPNPCFPSLRHYNSWIPSKAGIKSARRCRHIRADFSLRGWHQDLTSRREHEKDEEARCTMSFVWTAPARQITVRRRQRVPSELSRVSKNAEYLWRNVLRGKRGIS